MAMTECIVPDGEGDVAAIVEILIAQSDGGTLARRVFEAALLEHQVPARQYRAVLAALDAAGITLVSVVEEQEDGSVEEEESSPPDTGWNADGWDHFIKAHWH